jgi:hypothetical protein
VVSCTANTNPRHSISGSITGISGTVVLQDNSRDDLTMSADGTFKFPLQIPQGSVYRVTVKSAAGFQSQTCQFQNASGVVPDHDVSNVQVTCNANIGLQASVSGLSATGSVTLLNSDGDSLTIKTNGTTPFPTALTPGATYTVTVSSQPVNPSQTCAPDTSTVVAAPGATVTITCTTDLFPVGATVQGLPDNAVGATIDLVLQDNLGDDLTVPVSSTSPVSIVFPTQIASGSGYSVTVKTQPGADTSFGTTGVTQTSTVCLVSNGNGIVGAGPVTNVVVDCVRPTGFAYVTNKTDNTVSQYVVDSATGRLVESAPPIATGSGPSAAAIASVTHASYLYVTNALSNSMSVYDVDPNTGVLAPAAGSPLALPGLQTPTSLAIRGFQSIYVTNSPAAGGAGTVSAYTIGSGATDLTLLNQVPTGTAPAACTLYSPVGPGTTFLAVANSADNTLSGFPLDSTTGGPQTGQTAVPTRLNPTSVVSAGFLETTDIEVSPVEYYSAVYANGNDGEGVGYVSTFFTDANGQLTPKGSIFTAPGETSLLSTDDFQNDYLYAATSAGVYGFNIAHDGTLSPLPNSPYAAGTSPGPMAYLSYFVTNTNLFNVFVVDQSGESISAFTATNANTDSGNDGVLTPVATPTPIKTGHGPNSIVAVGRTFFGGE